MVISDNMDAVRCMANGKMYESKSQMSAAHRLHGCIEVGNEIEATMKVAAEKPARPRISKAEVAKALNKVRQGYRPDLPAN